MISAQYKDFYKTISKAMAELGTGVCMTLTPKEESILVDGKEVVVKSVDFEYFDDRINYEYKWNMDRETFRQFNTLLQVMYNQINATPKDDNNNGTGSASCSRRIEIRNA